MDITSMMGAANLVGGGYEPETYMIKFASDGTREGTIPCGRSMTTEEKADLISKGYEEVPAAEWQEYCSGKIRGEDGKPVDAPPHVPTKEEKLAQLESDYKAQKQELINQYADDMLHGDEEAIAEEKAAMESLDAWFDEEYAKIEGDE